MVETSLEWQSILRELGTITVESARAIVGLKVSVAYADGACISNPGGPAGWSTILVPIDAVVDTRIQPQAIEVYGHIPKAPKTTNNRAEISAVLATLSIAPHDTPLKIYSDSKYTINVAEGLVKMKVNLDLWGFYQILLDKRTERPTFDWVPGPPGQPLTEPPCA